jgi:hypothetical protein
VWIQKPGSGVTMSMHRDCEWTLSHASSGTNILTYVSDTDGIKKKKRRNSFASTFCLFSEEWVRKGGGVLGKID